MGVTIYCTSQVPSLVWMDALGLILTHVMIEMNARSPGENRKVFNQKLKPTLVKRSSQANEAAKDISNKTNHENYKLSLSKNALSF